MTGNGSRWKGRGQARGKEGGRGSKVLIPPTTNPGSATGHTDSVVSITKETNK
jgi:hypothetical protein